jgi:hypothetical protein
MRGEDIHQQELFSYGSLEERVPVDHPLRPIRTMVDEVLKALDGRFNEIYGQDGRKSIPPERLLRGGKSTRHRSFSMRHSRLKVTLFLRHYTGSWTRDAISVCAEPIYR